jgi:hypothetical protein
MRTVIPFRILLAPLAMVALVATVAAEDVPAPVADTPRIAAVQRDTLDLDTTSVTGNQELPKVLYIVPWKDADAGDLAGKPAQSLLDEVLAPIDREVFQRQLRYFEQLHAGDGGDAVQVSAPGE